MCCGPPLPGLGQPAYPASIPNPTFQYPNPHPSPNNYLNPLSPARLNISHSPLRTLTPRKRGIMIYPSSGSRAKPTLNSSNPFVDKSSSVGIPIVFNVAGAATGTGRDKENQKPKERKMVDCMESSADADGAAGEGAKNKTGFTSSSQGTIHHGDGTKLGKEEGVDVDADGEVDADMGDEYMAGDVEPSFEPPKRKSAKRVVDLADAIERDRRQRLCDVNVGVDPHLDADIMVNLGGGGDGDMGVAMEMDEFEMGDPSSQAEGEVECPPENALSGPEMIHLLDAETLYDHHMSHREWEDRLEVIQDIAKVNKEVSGLEGRYRLVDRLGEGTFSSVYKGIDIYHFRHNNRYWAEKSALHDPYELTEDGKPRLVHVALKRIYVTSSPERIFNELDIMEDLRGGRNIAQLISAFRNEDQVIAVMPYHPNDDYRLFYKHLDPPMMKLYFRCLFRALKDCHRRGIIHRDVKPANFLFDYEKGHGVLVDFGLAERYQPPAKIACQHSVGTYRHPHGSKINTPATHKVEQAVLDARKRERQGRVGFPTSETRPNAKANRAGTRGFRAPEVLLKCPDQTVAIDVWAAGIILFSALCHKFPIFNSNDDVEALLELGTVFGKTAMEKVSMLHNRTILTNIPPLKNPAPTLTDIVLTLNPRLYEPPCDNPTPEEAMSHVESVDSVLDFLKCLLTLDATRRLTAHQALMHPFLNDGLDEDEKEKEEEIQSLGKGACADFHRVTQSGQHIAIVHGEELTLEWGQGRAIGDQPCPYHSASWRPFMGDQPMTTVDDDYSMMSG